MLAEDIKLHAAKIKWKVVVLTHTVWLNVRLTDRTTTWNFTDMSHWSFCTWTIQIQTLFTVSTGNQSYMLHTHYTIKLILCPIVTLVNL